MLIDFDSRHWHPSFESVITPHLPPDFRARIIDADPAHTDVARDLILEIGDRDGIVDAALDWIKSNSIAAYHGSRLDDEGMLTVRRDGLLILDVASRISAAREKFPSIAHLITDDLADLVINKHHLAHREGQVHCTISRLFLEGSEYVHGGSEFDRRLVHFACGEENVGLVARFGLPRIVKLALPGEVVLRGFHPFFDIDYVRREEGVPNLVKDFLEDYAWRIHRPDYPVRGEDLCAMLKEPFPPEWVIGIDTVQTAVPA
jgi:hypothetical protein